MIISGVVALTLSPMMCSLILKPHGSQGRFADLIDRTFTHVDRLVRPAARPLARLSGRSRPCSRSWSWASPPSCSLHTKSELAPEEDQGIVFSLIKAPQYANLDYVDAYGKQLDEAFASFPETDTRFVVNGMQGGPNSGIAGMILKPWDERERTAMELNPLVQGKLNEITGEQVFAFSLPPLPGSTGGLPVQMVISSPAGYETVFGLMEEIKAAARKSGLFIVTDSDLAFNNPVIRVNIDRSKANDLGITMAAIGDTLATMVGGNYVNRFNLNGRSYEVIPQVPRAQRLSPESLGQYYVMTRSGEPVPLSTVVRIEGGTAPNALTQYNQLNSATFSAVPMPGVTMGQAVAFLERAGAEGAAGRLPARLPVRLAALRHRGQPAGDHLRLRADRSSSWSWRPSSNRLRDPFVILVSVPMSICGALLPLFFGLGTLNIYTQIGLVTLIGLISKHGILMVEFANELQRNENLDRRAAIEQAARVRLRPILMTTAAMVVGLFPLLAAAGAGAASRFAIGLVIVSGMLIGTLFTLFVLPAVYTMLAADHRPATSARRTEELAAVS